MNRRIKTIKNILSSVITFLIVITSFLVAIGFSFNFVYIKTNVHGFSMYPTLNKNVDTIETAGDTIFINRFRALERNNVVVAKVSWFDNYIVKRLVGLPDDEIQIKEVDGNYLLFVNDELIYSKEKSNESSRGNTNENGTIGYYNKYIAFLNNEKYSKNVVINSKGEKCIKLNENEYFLMGDNWGESLDCLSKGPVNKSNIVGVVDLVVDYKDNLSNKVFEYIFKNLFS